MYWGWAAGCASGQLFALPAGRLLAQGTGPAPRRLGGPRFAGGKNSCMFDWGFKNFELWIAFWQCHLAAAGEKRFTAAPRQPPRPFLL